MNDLTIFKFEDKAAVRVIRRNHEPWFVARDICNVLGIKDSRDVLEGLDEDEWGKTTVIDSMGRKQETYIVSESGMYALVIRSNKPAAKKFSKWITSEVLPSIRKTGSYRFVQTFPVGYRFVDIAMMYGVHIDLVHKRWREVSPFMTEHEDYETAPYRLTEKGLRYFTDGGMLPVWSCSNPAITGH